MPRFHKYQVDGSYFTDIDTPDKAYWLGVLAADGCVSNAGNKWRLELMLAEKDCDWLQSFRTAISSTHPIRSVFGGFGTPCCKLAITNQSLCVSLLALEFKSSAVLEHVPSQLYCHFIRGLFDGDGYIRHEMGTPRHTGYVPHTPEWSLVSQSHELLERLQHAFAQACDIPMNKLSFHNNAWRWKVRGNKQVKRIWAFLYPEGDYPFLPRKRDLFGTAPPSGLRFPPHTAVARAQREAVGLLAHAESHSLQEGVRDE